MSLDLFTRSSDMAISAAAANPAVDLGDGLTDAFSAGYDAVRSYRSSDSEHRSRFDYVQGVLDKVFSETGERYLNPIGQSAGRKIGRFETVYDETAPQAVAYAKIRNRLAQLQKERPDLGLGLLTNEEVEAGGVGVGQKGAQAEIAANSRVVSRSAAFGRLAGNIVGSLVDPVNVVANVATLPLALQGTLLKVAGQQAGVGGASEFLVQAINYDYRQKVDPDYSMSEAAGEVSTAALGSAVLGVGVNVSNRVIARAWDSYKGNGQFIPKALKDKANVVKRAAATATNPFKSKSVASEIVHNQAITKAADDIMTGRPVELPPDTFLQANARPGRVYDADGRSVGVNYEVVEARELVTSHTEDFLPNANFPQELQPRARERPVTQEQVINMSANLQPERLGPSPQADSGAPVVGPDGLVESGNGRVMAIRKAYQDGNLSAGNYRNFLRSQGFDTTEMEAPVLVARRVTDLPGDERLKFVTAANRSTAMKLSAPEQALSDARLVDPASLKMLEGGDVGSAANRNFVRAFLSKLPRSEQGNLVDAHGNLSLEGNKRLTAGLLGRAYGEPTLLARALEDADSNIKTLAGALSDAAGAWSKMRDDVSHGIIPQGMDITDELLSAIRLIMKSRDEGVSLKNLLDQPEMFDGPSDVAKMLAKFMFRDGDTSKPTGRRAVADMLRTYAEEANKNLTGGRLFGEALQQADVLKSSLGKVGRSDLVPQAGDFIGSWRRRVSQAMPAATDLIRQGVLTLEKAVELKNKAEAFEKELIDTVFGTRAAEFRKKAKSDRTYDAMTDMLEEAETKFPGVSDAFFAVNGRFEDTPDFWRDVIKSIDFEGADVEHLGSMLRTGVDKLPEGKASGEFSHSEVLGIAQVAAILNEAADRNIPQAEIFNAAIKRAVELEGRDAAELMRGRLENFKSMLYENPATRIDYRPLAETATNSDAVEKIINDPAVDDAVLLEGDRMLAQELTGKGPKIMVPYKFIDSAGNEVETMRPMSEVMDELDEQIVAADRIKSCSVGTEASP